MEFDFSAEQKELQAQVRRFLSDRCSRETVRAVLEGPQSCDLALWQSLGDLGYLGASIPQAYGGLGAGYLEACVIAEELGRALAPVPFASSIALVAECLLAAGTEAQKLERLPGLATGRAVATLAVAESPGRVSPGRLNTIATVEDGAVRLSGSKLAVIDGDVADFAVVAAVEAAGAQTMSLYLVDLKAEGVTRSQVPTIDPTRSHARIDFKAVAAQPLGEPGKGWAILERVLDRAAVMVAFEQIGGADRALEMARDYALQRYAFGRPIGSMQAIKHMLADMYVSATLARSNGYYGAWALSSDVPELPEAAASARVSATQAYQHCARNNIQVHGGMGFTWQFDCHLYYRRSNLLALMLGSLSEWEDRLIERLRPREAA